MSRAQEICGGRCVNLSGVFPLASDVHNALTTLACQLGSEETVVILTAGPQLPLTRADRCYIEQGGIRVVYISRCVCMQ